VIEFSVINWNLEFKAVSSTLLAVSPTRIDSVEPPSFVMLLQDAFMPNSKLL